MVWTIFITNLFNDQYSFAKILQMYGIRWNIEKVFKALKSELNLEGIHNAAKYQLRFIVQARSVLRAKMKVTIRQKIPTITKCSQV